MNCLSHISRTIYTWVQYLLLRPLHYCLTKTFHFCTESTVQVVRLVSRFFAFVIDNTVVPLLKFMNTYFVRPLFVNSAKFGSWMGRNIGLPILNGAKYCVNGIWRSIVFSVDCFKWCADTTIRSLFNVCKWIVEGAVAPILRGVRNTITWSWNNILYPPVNLAKRGIYSTWNMISSTPSWIASNVLSPIYNSRPSTLLGSGVRFTVSSLWRGTCWATRSVYNAINYTTKTTFNGLHTIISGVLSGVKGTILFLEDRILIPVFQTYWNAVKWVSRTFVQGASYPTRGLYNNILWPTANLLNMCITEIRRFLNFIIISPILRGLNWTCNGIVSVMDVLAIRILKPFFSFLGNMFKNGTYHLLYRPTSALVTNLISPITSWLYTHIVFKYVHTIENLLTF